MNPKIPPEQRKVALILLILVLIGLAYYVYLIGSFSFSWPVFLVKSEKVLVLILSGMLHISWEILKKRRPDRARLINLIHKIQFVAALLLIAYL